MAFKVSKPSSGGGTGFVKDEHLDHLVMFVEPVAEETSTAYGDGVAARCSYVVCLSCDAVVGTDARRVRPSSRARVDRPR